MNKHDYKPGNGWKHLGGAVYEKTNGIRIHVMGLIRLKDGTHIKGNEWPEHKEMSRFIRINGYNRKRGMMAWANTY